MQLPRLFWWSVTTLFLAALIYTLAPQQLPVSLYKLSLLTMAGVIGYWFDRSLFPYARPDAFIVKVGPDDTSCDVDLSGPNCDCKIVPWEVVDGDGFVFVGAMIRRAIIVGCAMLAIGLGA